MGDVRGRVSHRWRKIRAAVLARDGWVCQMNGPTCTGVATTVDHMDPLALGGVMLPDPSRLRAACVACNSRDGQRLSTRSHRLGTPSREWR